MSELPPSDSIARHAATAPNEPDPSGVLDLLDLAPPPLLTRPASERAFEPDSEAYLTSCDTDFLSTDDEGASRSFNSSLRNGLFQSFSSSTADQSLESANEGCYGLGLSAALSELDVAGVPDTPGLSSFSNLATLRAQARDPVDALWNTDLARVVPGDEDDEDPANANAARPRIVDWSRKPIEVNEVVPTTTHLLLSQSLTPLLVAPLLNMSIPSISQGLVVLDISLCGLSEIPQAIASCTALEELDIHGNRLATATLPSFLGTLTSLFVLVADSCDLAVLPSSLSQLSRLHTLTLRQNRLRALPSWLSRLTNLEVLLVDGNPFHWQFQNLVRPLVPTLTDSPLADDQSSPNTPMQHAFPTSAPPRRTEFSRPPTPARPPPPPPPPPIKTSSATPSIAPSPAPASRVPSPLPPPLPFSEPNSGANSPTAGDADSKKSWGRRLFKKVSSTRLNGKRPGALGAESRTYSEPVTRAEESEAEGKSSGIFGSRKAFRKKSSRPPLPTALVGLGQDTVRDRRRSYLVLDAFKTPTDGASSPRLAGPSPHNHQVALKSVLAYLRDLDDLSQDLSLPNIPLDAPAPSLRHSPSLGVLSPSPRVESPSMRRAQSTRHPLPSRSPRPSSSRFPKYSDDSPTSSPGRSTPLPNSTFSPNPDSIEGSKPVKMKNDPIQREAVLKEIVETEQTYLRGLEELCAIYVANSAKTVTSTGGKKDPILPLAERRAVFGNIETIRDFHRTVFLPDVLAAVRAGGPSEVVAARVGEIFCQHGGFLKIYSAYVNGFNGALAQIQDWASSGSGSGRPSTGGGSAGGNAGASSSVVFDPASQTGSNLTQSQKKRIKSWLKRCRAHPQHSQISLESYLLLPVQRIPRYRLLLESLLACTPATIPPSTPVPPVPFTTATDLPTPADSSPSFLSASPVPPAVPWPLQPHPSIVSAVLEMDLVAKALNEGKRETEGRAQLLAWQGRIVNRYKSSLVQPHRTLLRSGKMVLTRTVKRSTTRIAPTPPLPSRENGSGRSHLGASPSDLDGGRESYFDLPPEEEVHTLFTESSAQELIVLLCTDLLILVKAPPPPLDQDPNAPVELYTVIRLNRGPEGVVRGVGRPSRASGDAPVSLFGKDEDILRIKVGHKAILYLQHPSSIAHSPSLAQPSTTYAGDVKRKRRTEARQWRDAINLQWEINT
ncbi:hypothetical protein JCM10212_003685 [Sporobolomyces blumeae]